MTCGDICLMMDDRWGGIECLCEREAGHDGDHEHTLTATMPLARLVWGGEPR